MCIRDRARVNMGAGPPYPRTWEKGELAEAGAFLLYVPSIFKSKGKRQSGEVQGKRSKAFGRANFLHCVEDLFKKVFTCPFGIPELLRRAHPND